jgi:hypothetical protein
MRGALGDVVQASRGRICGDELGYRQLLRGEHDGRIRPHGPDVHSL